VLGLDRELRLRGGCGDAAGLLAVGCRRLLVARRVDGLAGARDEQPRRDVRAGAARGRQVGDVGDLDAPVIAPDELRAVGREAGAEVGRIAALASVQRELATGLKPLFSASARLEAVYSQMAAWWVRAGDPVRLVVLKQCGDPPVARDQALKSGSGRAGFVPARAGVLADLGDALLERRSAQPARRRTTRHSTSPMHCSCRSRPLKVISGRPTGSSGLPPGGSWRQR
jgi:hypothetical protein